VIASDDGSSDERLIPLLEGKTAKDGRAAAYLCQNFSCAAPVTSADQLAAALA